VGRVYIAKGMICILALLGPCVLAAAPPEVVNILSWWGYIDGAAPETKQVEKKCNARISVDTYYSNTEFESRLHKPTGVNYDMLIHSGTIMSKIKEKIGDKGPSISSLANDYDAAIKAHYDATKYPRNTVIFQVSLTGFLWNSANIQFNENDSLESIFNKASGKLIVLIDDYVEVLTLFHQSHCKGFECISTTAKSFPDNRSLRSLLDSAKVLISNDLARIPEHPDFSFAYTWSGGAVKHLASREGKKKLRFLVHPKLSHISLDLLTLMNSRPTAICVARELGSKSFIKDLSQTSHYFSPYGPVEINVSNEFRTIQTEFFKQVGSLRWLDSYSAKDLSIMQESWQNHRLVIGKGL